MPDDSNPFRIAGLQGLTATGVSAQRGLESAAQRMEGLKNGSKANGLKPPHGARGGQDEIAKAATEFEALLLHQMLNEMWKTVPKDGLFQGGQEAELYRDMLNQGIANEIAQKQSLGIKDVVVRDMHKALKK